MTIGERIQKILKKLNLTQTDLASYISESINKTMSPSTVSAWVINKSSPSVKMLELISEITDCDMYWLVTGKGKPFPKTESDPEDKICEIDLSEEAKTDEKIRKLLDSVHDLLEVNKEKNIELEQKNKQLVKKNRQLEKIIRNLNTTLKQTQDEIAETNIYQMHLDIKEMKDKQEMLIKAFKSQSHELKDFIVSKLSDVDVNQKADTSN